MNYCDFMPYLICENCSGYYELNVGESPNDFQACQCGGSLKYYENMDDYTQNEKRNYNTEKSRQYGDMDIYENIKREETYSYLEKRDKIMNASKSQSILVNSAFIILIFTIFPLELGLIYFPFYIMAALALILSTTIFYLQYTNKINTIGEIRKIFGICGVYFILLFLISFVWIATNLYTFVFTLMNNKVVFGLFFGFAFLFTQKFMGNYLSREIYDPLESMDVLTKYIYYVGVFYTTAWFLFAIFAAFYYVSYYGGF